MSFNEELSTSCSLRVKHILAVQEVPKQVLPLMHTKKKTYHIRDVLYVKQPNPKQNLDRVRGEL